MLTTTILHDASPSPLPHLLLRYVAGQITDTSWSAFMDALDAADATPEEREAFARFYDDALFEVGSDAVRIPKRDELTDLLSDIRPS